MAIFTVTSFSTFAGLLLAAQKLAADPNPLNRVKAFADLATGGKALAALNNSGLTPLAQEMARQAEGHALHFTHPGPARDDAIALFWQVAPAALADPAVFAGADLDPDRTTDAMVAAIKASPLARDFTAAPLPEAFFRSVTRQTLDVMLVNAAYIATITPDLWRETLYRHGIEIELLQAVKDDTAEILALVRELRETKATTIHQDTLIAIARKIRPNVPDKDEALRALENAVDLAAEMQARGEAGGNVDAFIDAVLRRLAALTADGHLDEAASEADAAVDQAQAGLAQLLDAAVNQHLLAFDAEGAARQIARRVTLETPDPSDHFAALQREQYTWFERGRDKGLRLDLEVTIALARTGLRRASNADQRGAALNDLGATLATLGAWESGVARLEQAVAAYRAALKVWTRELAPLDWATTQMNLGNALAMFGARESGTARFEQAVAAYHAALEEQTRERVPLDWAMTQMNLGNVLQTLGARENGTARLEQAVAAHQAALKERTRERMPFDWAMTQMNLGNALQTLGARESGTARLEQAVEAYRAALNERIRERVPLDWAMTQTNLGIALSTLGARERGTARLKQAIAAYLAALEELTRERAPHEWARTQMNLGNTLQTLGARESGTARLEQAVAAYRAALEVWTRERVPLDWAATIGNLGSALLTLSERTGDLEGARAALSRLHEGAAVLRSGGHVPWADTFEREIPRAEAVVACLEAGTAGDRGSMEATEN